MDMWFTIMLVLHVVVALGIIGLVLLQQGKGSEMGAAFGGGASGSLFGATGSANFLSRSTSILVTVFFLTSIGLAYIASNKPRAASAVDEVLSAPAATPAVETPGAAPAVPANDSKTNEVPK
ncbi:MAG TPA: preprotein translocase subunit SecG [Burkholderiales bacterium]|nr:preprotein translocase subunit SecG [Burkholderiales bacterium]